MPVAADPKDDAVLVSHAGVPLIRSTTFRFTLDVTPEQHQVLFSHAGSSRLAYNHQIGRVRANLDQRAAERSYDIPEADLTPALSWSKVSSINHMNAWKDGRAPTPGCRTTTRATRSAGCRGVERCRRTCSSAPA